MQFKLSNFCGDLSHEDPKKTEGIGTALSLYLSVCKDFQVASAGLLEYIGCLDGVFVHLIIEVEDFGFLTSEP